MLTTDMNVINIEAAAQWQPALVNWADWWAERGNEVFDAPAVLVDIEPLQN